MHKQYIFRINFNMQQKSKSSQNQPIDEGLTFKANIPRTKKIPKQKIIKKAKNTKYKNNIEKSTQAIPSINNIDVDNNMIKQKSDEDNSVTTYQSTCSRTNLAIPFISQPNTLLSRLIKRPPYIAISKSNKISGSYGHSTAIFKRPILQGNYYLEILIREDRKNQKQVKYPSAVRLGICPHQYNCQVPLGCGESIAYKSCDGNFVRNGQIIERGQPYATNDIIGILMNISPPHKISNPSQINEGSSVSFYKNGRLISQVNNLKQIFYCFGISLYNYSQVEILEGVNKYDMKCQSKHYFCVIDEKIPYKDLADNKIFKI